LAAIKCNTLMTEKNMHPPVSISLARVVNKCNNKWTYPFQRDCGAEHVDP
jgi:hypothetical protein